MIRKPTAIRMAASLPTPRSSSHLQAGYNTKLISAAKLSGISISRPKYRISDPYTIAWRTLTGVHSENEKNCLVMDIVSCRHPVRVPLGRHFEGLDLSGLDFPLFLPVYQLTVDGIQGFQRGLLKGGSLFFRVEVISRNTGPYSADFILSVTGLVDAQRNPRFDETVRKGFQLGDLIPYVGKQ